jgi:hypothetical protein
MNYLKLLRASEGTLSQGLCLSSGGINRLMMMMMLKLAGLMVRKKLKEPKHVYGKETHTLPLSIIVQAYLK